MASHNCWHHTDRDLASKPRRLSTVISVVSRSRDRIANPHRWLVAITGSDLHWHNPRLNDALLETSFWMIDAVLAIDPAMLTPAND